jgi:hypothetical protein
MRLRLLIATAAACALLIVPASASAAYSIGISGNLPSMFSDPLFTGLGVKYARVVLPWNVMTANDGRLPELQSYVAQANAQGVQVLATFEHTRGDASLCFRRSNFRKSVCKLPSLSAYEAQMKRFLAAFPTVRTISPWNEINHFSQGTSRDPRAAARFTDKVRQLCPSCTIVAADVLDQADDPSAAHPTFRQTSSYIKRFRHFLKTPRTICGIHNYSDVNRFRSTGTKALMKALGCKQYWFTETGGLYRFGSFWSKKTKKGCSTNASCQLKATKYMFSLANANRKVTRLYIYTWFGGITPRFDAGLVAAGKPRPAYHEVEKRLG